MSRKVKEVLERHYTKPRAPWTRTEPPQELVELIESGKVAPCKAIDVGCGEGFHSIYLASKGFDVLGIDLSERAIRYAKENAARRGVKVRFVAMDIADLGQITEKFDFILEWSLLHQITLPQRQKYVKDVAKILNRNGKYLSVCFNQQSAEFGNPGEKYRISPSGMKLYFSSQKELKELFEQYFHIIEMKLLRTPHVANYFFMEKP